MCTTQNAQPNDLDVFIHRGGRDHVGMTSNSQVNDLKACISQRPGDQLQAAIMTIEPRFG